MGSIPEHLLICDVETTKLISAVIRRFSEHQHDADALSLSMDLTVCHNLEHVDLPTLLAARWNDFAHDVSGIIRHLDRTTGELTDCFVPRCRKTDRAPEATTNKE